MRIREGTAQRTPSGSSRDADSAGTPYRRTIAASSGRSANLRRNSISEWSYIVLIKWTLFALILSLGSVYLMDLIKSAVFPPPIINSGSNTNDGDNNLPLPGTNPPQRYIQNEDASNQGSPSLSASLGQDFQEFIAKVKIKVGKPLSTELDSWMTENQLEEYVKVLQEVGIVSLVSVVQLDEIVREDRVVDWSNQKQSPPTPIDQGQDLGSLNSVSEEERAPRDLDALATSVINRIPIQDRERLKRAARILRQRLILRLWLDDHGLVEYAARFNSLGVNSIEDAYWFEDLKKLEYTIGKKILPMWTVARQSLPTGIATLETLKTKLWNRLVNLDNQTIWNTWGTMLLVTLSVTGFGAMVSYFPQVLDAKKAIFQYVSGKFSLACNCQVEFDWEDPVPVGQTCTMKVRFFQRGGRPYPVCDKDNILVEVRKDSQKISVVTEFGGKDSGDVNLCVIKFSVRKAGQYSINLLAENSHVKGSPFTKTFLPGPIEPSKTIFLKQTSTVVCVTGSSHKLIVEPRDSYGNRCRTQDFHLDSFNFTTGKIGNENQTEKSCSIQFAYDYSNSSGAFGMSIGNSNLLSVNPNPNGSSGGLNFDSGRVALTTRFPEPGVYRGTLTYEKEPIHNGSFEILALTPAEAAAVQKNVAVKSPNAYYEGKLISIGNDIQNKARKIYVTVSAKQLMVKEYFLKLLPIRVATFRLSPNTKIQFNGMNNQTNLPSILTIDDGAQPPVKLTVKDAKIVVATFTHFLLRNIGGSETFQDKQEYFFKELRDFHRKHTRDKVSIKLTRENIIESTWKTTKNLSSHDWCRNFDISFLGEQGIDWGGLRREWFEKVSSKLFESGNPVGMFSSFPESHLVHPNPNSRWKPKHYEMAGKIVGKALFESSLGAAYRQMVKAKFTRSFFAQLIGLRVNYKYFEQDDPELYLRKIKFILENDVEGMELTFIEEEYELGKLIKTVDLIPDGSKIIVTNENKKNYLNALAQYRLCTKVKNEIEAFIKGLNEIVPDDLLTIFDENELELLMCGTSEYSVTDLREHHIICGSSDDYRKVLDWFWSIVGNMTEEEKGRLLQFTTGSSLLPPGGFKELSPLFQIIFSPSSGCLPTAHTCFNQLCLPDYDSYEAFEKCLRIAINEGSEGFGLI